MIGGLLGVVAAGAVLYAAGGGGLAERPVATGDVGVLRVYGQLESGPALLRPGMRRELPRPNDLAFQFDAQGIGPRQLRIEIDDGVQRRVMHEVRLVAPQDHAPLAYVMHLDDAWPELLQVTVTVEAPHAQSVQSTLPIRLLPRTAQ